MEGSTFLSPFFAASDKTVIWRKETLAVHTRSPSVTVLALFHRDPEVAPEHEVSFRLFFSLEVPPPPPSSSLLPRLLLCFIMNIIGGCPERAFSPASLKQLTGCVVSPCACPRVVPVHLSALSGRGTRLFFTIRRRCLPSQMPRFAFRPVEAS